MKTLKETLLGLLIVAGILICSTREVEEDFIGAVATAPSQEALLDIILNAPDSIDEETIAWAWEEYELWDNHMQ